MKALCTIMFILILTTTGWSTNNSAYQKAMQKSLSALNEAEDIATMQAVANRFERIALAEKDQWLPWYYTAYAHIAMSTMSKETAQKDQYLDQAQHFLDQATAIETSNAELVALQGYLYMIRVSIDAASRGQQLAPKATQALSQAAQMDPKNPRAFLLLGQMQYGTAQFFNNDTSDACKLIDKSVQLFEEQPDDQGIEPSWGQETAIAIQQRCS